jgi:hypothetical protein
MLMSVAAQSTPLRSKAVARLASSPAFANSVYLIIPDSTTATAT